MHGKIVKHFSKYGLSITNIDVINREPFAHRDTKGMLKMVRGEDICEIKGILTCDPSKLETLKDTKLALNIIKIIFNGVTTIVFWDDGTKTIVKCSDRDSYDQEKAVLMAMYKKLCGSCSGLIKTIISKGIFPKTIPKTKPEKKEVKIPNNVFLCFGTYDDCKAYSCNLKVNAGVDICKTCKVYTLGKKK